MFNIFSFLTLKNVPSVFLYNVFLEGDCLEDIPVKLIFLYSVSFLAYWSVFGAIF